jgi:hypothetical protein
MEEHCFGERKEEAEEEAPEEQAMPVFASSAPGVASTEGIALEELSKGKETDKETDKGGENGAKAEDEEDAEEDEEEEVEVEEEVCPPFMIRQALSAAAWGFACDTAFVAQVEARVAAQEEECLARAMKHLDIPDEELRSAAGTILQSRITLLTRTIGTEIANVADNEDAGIWPPTDPEGLFTWISLDNELAALKEEVGERMGCMDGLDTLDKCEKLQLILNQEDEARFGKRQSAANNEEGEEGFDFEEDDGDEGEDGDEDGENTTGKRDKVTPHTPPQPVWREWIW